MVFAIVISDTFAFFGNFLIIQSARTMSEERFESTAVCSHVTIEIAGGEQVASHLLRYFLYDDSSLQSSSSPTWGA